MNENGNTALAVAGVSPEGSLADVLAGRANIIEMTQAVEDAVLRPADPGCWSHPLRAALAARTAWVQGAEALAGHYLEGAGDQARLADPEETATEAPLTAAVAFIDKVSARTRDVVAADIAGLQAAGVADADIVRLTQLCAFVSYQVRLVAGLRLMARGGS